MRLLKIGGKKRKNGKNRRNRVALLGALFVTGLIIGGAKLEKRSA